MDEKCEFLDCCGFFLHFTSNLEVNKQGWIQLYCENLEHSELCERKKVWKETGTLPADNLSPIGTML